MQLEDLEEFCTLCETLSFSETADRHYVTEAALSRHIKRLEEQVGGQLFHRTTRRVEVSALGKVLLPYAQKAAMLKTEIDSAVSEQLVKQRTCLNVAAISIIDTYIDLSRLIFDFCASHPDIVIDLTTPTKPITELLNEKICEIGFVPELTGSEHPGLERLLIQRDQLVALLPANHVLAQKQSLTVEDLKDEKLILVSNRSPLYSLCIQLCQLHGFQPKVVLTMASGTNIRKVVESGMGIGLLLEHPSRQLHPDYPTGGQMIFRQFEMPVYVDFNLVYTPAVTRAGKVFNSFVRSSIESGKNYKVNN